MVDAQIRAQVLRVLCKVTGGVPTLSTDEAVSVASRRLTRRDIRFLHAAGEEDLALLNACLIVEEEFRREQFATLERLLAYCQFDDGTLDERILALPDHAFARAALDLYELGWVTSTEEE